MSTTNTEPEAVDRLGVAIGTWARAATGIATQASAATRALATEVEAELRRRVTRVAALEAALRAAAEEEHGAIAAQLTIARQLLDQARSAATLAEQAVRQAQRLERRTGESAQSRVPDAMRSLSRKSAALAEYQAVPVPSGTTGVASGPGPVDYGVPGIVDIPVDDATWDDNPILDGFTKGGASKNDYRWAVETWETTVRPGVLAGKTREDFAARDAQMGRHTGFRRLSGVYDMFLGSDSIAVERRPNGTLDPKSGRHRLEIAKELGISRLPGKHLG